MTTAITVEIRPAHPISRLAAPSSASTKDSALSRASSETTTVSASEDEAFGGELSAAMLPPKHPSAGLFPGLYSRRIEAGLVKHGKRFHGETLGALSRGRDARHASRTCFLIDGMG